MLARWWPPGPERWLEAFTVLLVLVVGCAIVLGPAAGATGAATGLTTGGMEKSSCGPPSLSGLATLLKEYGT